MLQLRWTRAGQNGHVPPLRGHRLITAPNSQVMGRFPSGLIAPMMIRKGELMAEQRKVTKSERAKVNRAARKRKAKGKVSRADIKRAERPAVKKAKRRAARDRLKRIQERAKTKAEKATME